jgi:hypothetical protein
MDCCIGWADAQVQVSGAVGSRATRRSQRPSSRKQQLAFALLFDHQ